MASHGSPFHQRTQALAAGNFPAGILAVALKNNKRRFFIPSSMDSFATIPYEYAMIDNGCSTIVKPFPGMRALQAFKSDAFAWKIGRSSGTGPLKAFTLTISHKLNLPIGQIVSANKFVMGLPGLRFHLSTASAQLLLDEDIFTSAFQKHLLHFVGLGLPSVEGHGSKCTIYI